MSNPKYLQSGFEKQLAHAIEECGEFLAAAGKTQRWGLHSVNPEIPTVDAEPNMVWLLRELIDVQEAMGRLRWTLAEKVHNAYGPQYEKVNRAIYGDGSQSQSKGGE
jgi:hypothetical protein